MMAYTWASTSLTHCEKSGRGCTSILRGKRHRIRYQFKNSEPLSQSKPLSQFFKEQHYDNTRAVNKIYDILQQPHLRPGKALLKAKKFKAILLAQKLQHMAADMQCYFQRLQQLVDQHPDGAIFLSYPAVSHGTTARLIDLFGNNRALFSDVSELRALASTCPVTEKSGKSQVTYFRRACNKRRLSAL